jgi:hypothetical protein
MDQLAILRENSDIEGVEVSERIGLSGVPELKSKEALGR